MDNNTFQKKLITLAVTLLFLVCAIYANFYAIRRMERYAVEAYFYNKLQVALQFGGVNGLNNELNSIDRQYGQKRQHALAEEFKKVLPQLKNPGQYLSDTVTEREARITRIKSFRLTAMLIIIAIFSWRLYAGYYARSKRNKT
ncbi:MAG: hypothetical protein WC417_01590 [Candidatus Omnitrophota bacterium]|jgi:hypothetical protein